MTANPAEDWRALSENYRSMSDDQLCELAENLGDLTQTAQQVLRDEMNLRKLGDPQAPTWQPATPQDASIIGQGSAQVEYTWKTLLCVCESREQVWQFGEVLRRVGIESWLDTPRDSIDATGLRLLVAADQLDQARMIVASPIPQDIVDASRMDDDAVYDLPTCPRCGAADPILEGVDPVNSWTCETCGAEWTE